MALAAWVRLSRPAFLLGGVAMLALGVLLTQPGRGVPWWQLGIAQVFVTSLQLFVHWSNESMDVAADRAQSRPTAWTGGSRVLAQGDLGILSVRLALVRLAWVIVAVFFAAAWLLPPAALVTMAVLVIVAGGYSEPPFCWQARGLGPFATVLAVAVLVPVLGWQIAGGTPVELTPLLPLALWMSAMLLVFDLADATTDEAAGKRTFVVRIGQERARWLAWGAWIAGAGLLVPGWQDAWPLAAGLPFAAWAAVSLPRMPPTPARSVWMAASVVAVAAAALLAVRAWAWLLHNP